MTIEFNDKLETPPMFIAEFPFEKKLTIFDVYFNMDNSTWVEINVDNAIYKMKEAYANLVPSQKLVQNIYVPTPEIARLNTCAEVLITAQQPFIVCGEAASGKSSFVKEFINTNLFEYAKEVSTEHVTSSYHLDCIAFKEYVERYLEVKKIEPKPADASQGGSKSLLNNPSSLRKLNNQSLNSLGTSPGPITQRDETVLTNKTLGTVGTLEDESKKLRPGNGKEAKLVIYLEDLHLA